MKISVGIYKVVVVFLVLLIAGCQSKRTETQPESGKPATTTVDKRGYDPLELPEDRQIVPIEHPRAGEISGIAVFVEAESRAADTVLSGPAKSGPTIDSLSSQAYRIQLFTSKVYGEANDARRVAEEIFDYPVFMDYEVPYFKVRVGSFAARDDAEKYLMRVKSAGYTDAWVVTVTVRIKETSPLYYDTQLPVRTDTASSDAEEIMEDDQSQN